MLCHLPKKIELFKIINITAKILYIGREFRHDPLWLSHPAQSCTKKLIKTSEVFSELWIAWAIKTENYLRQTELIVITLKKYVVAKSAFLFNFSVHLIAQRIVEKWHSLHAKLFSRFFFFTFNEFAYFMAICVSSFRTVVQHSVRHTALDLPLLALSLVYNCSFGKKTNSIFFSSLFRQQETLKPVFLYPLPFMRIYLWQFDLNVFVFGLVLDDSGIFSTCYKYCCWIGYGMVQHEKATN